MGAALSCISPMDSKKKIAILGATGLIGSACKRHFETLGCNLVCPSRQEVDLLQKAQLEAFLKGEQVDALICAVGLVGGIHYNKTYPADFIALNLHMQLNLFEAAQAAEVERVVYFASSCMYPKVCPQPMSEELLLTGALEPTSLSYAMAKLAGVQMARAFNQQFGVERFVALIPNSTFGPNDDFNPQTGHVMSALLARFHQAKEQGLPSVTLWGTGRARREFIHADDVARAVAHVLWQKGIPLPLNVGVGYDVSIRELAEMIADIVDYRGELIWDATKPEGALQKLLDSNKLKGLGWSPSRSLRQGIEETYHNYLESHDQVSV